ncbi:hypothetical protein [Phenylobacterium aquaticum]|uniref:hypothetical protein n=1 Tax=Phenylobacterium aquaticum TaxID=1763816 RepID=UPI001F5C161A|nr:hypothetical protein [Phenylobacterium aquaticum]MCI3133333.1 hypothetical protein [Phenylobacterium aquaticum]
MRSISVIAVVAFAMSLASAADAAPCKDAKGKFMKCPAPAVAPGVRCQDKTSKKFAKCGAPNSQPIPAKPK